MSQEEIDWNLVDCDLPYGFWIKHLGKMPQIGSLWKTNKQNPKKKKTGKLFCASQSKFPFLLYCTVLQPNARQINLKYIFLQFVQNSK